MYAVCLGKGEGGGDGNEARSRAGIRSRGASAGALGHVLGVTAATEGLVVGTLPEFCGERRTWAGVWGTRRAGREEAEWRSRNEPRSPCPPPDPHGALGGLAGPCTLVPVPFQQAQHLRAGTVPSPRPSTGGAPALGPTHVHSRLLRRHWAPWLDNPRWALSWALRDCSSVPGGSQKCIPKMFPDVVKCHLGAKRPRLRARVLPALPKGSQAREPCREKAPSF